jgi:hypothetical protein
MTQIRSAKTRSNLALNTLDLVSTVRSTAELGGSTRRLAAPAGLPAALAVKAGLTATSGRMWINAAERQGITVDQAAAKLLRQPPSRGRRRSGR